MKNIRAGLPKLHVRPATAREPRRYLAEPAFSSCTVPVVWFPMNSFNFAHAFKGVHKMGAGGALCRDAGAAVVWLVRNCCTWPACASTLETDAPHISSPHLPPTPAAPCCALPAADNGAVMYSALKETPWADHVRLVPVTGEALALSPTNRLLWQPLTGMRLDAWDEFSVRIPDDKVGSCAALGRCHAVHAAQRCGVAAHAVGCIGLQ